MGDDDMLFSSSLLGHPEPRGLGWFP